MDNIPKNSRQRFREYLKEHGFFGSHKLHDEHKDNPLKKEITGEERESRSSLYYLRRYLSTIRDQRGRLLLALLLVVVSRGLNAALPWSSKYMLDHVLPEGNLDLLYWACGGLFLIGVAQVCTSVGQDLLARKMIGNYVATIKRRLIQHLQSLPLARLQQLKVGGVVTRIQSDVERMADLLHMGLLSPIGSLLMFIIALTSMLYLSVTVTLVCLVFCILVGVIAFTFFNRLRPLHRTLRRELADIGGRLTEIFNGVQVVRIFGRERYEKRHFALDTHFLWRKQLHADILSMGLHRTMWTIHWLMIICMWLIGGYYYTRGELTLGGLITFIMFVDWLFRPIFMIMHSFSHLQQSMACAERVFDLMDEPRDMPDSPGAVDAGKLERELSFDNVTFDYPDGTRALNDINLAIPRGSVTALVGPSGAGKTTLINLICRFYDPTSGAVRVDGQDIREFTVESYRRFISLVLQEVFLFDGTVRGNITYGNPRASEEEVIAVAKAAHCHEFISDLEKGYNSLIGERGVKLSMGQKQRLALARALLTDPQILILDEATSNLDSESEALIQDALRTIFRERTVIVIAHRLSTIIDADKIAVVDAGCIVEEGTHEELLSRKGRYRELYTRQMERAEVRRQIIDW